MGIFLTALNIENVHLTKETGLIAWGMGRYCKMKSCIVTYDNDDYENMNYVPGLKLVKMRKLTGIYDADILLFLMKYSKKIDVLNCYHMRSATFLKILVYRMLNRKGKIYLKLDGGYAKETIHGWKRKIFKKMFRMCDLVSTEIDSHAKMLSEDWNAEIQSVPSPFHPKSRGSFRKYDQRENMILTVGRLGTEQKATEILLEAWGKIFENMDGWKLVLTGPVEKEETDFQQYIDEWYQRYPKAKEVTEFSGNISDREQLKELYQNAKIFVFPSRHESFGMAVLEAIVNGVFIVGSDIYTNRALTEDFTLGYSFKTDDIEELSEKLLMCQEDMEKIEAMAYKLYKIAADKYSLKNICKKAAFDLGLDVG